MTWVFAATAVAVLVAGWWVARGHGGALAALPEHPDTELTGHDVRRSSFGLVPRGYAIAAVDDLLDRVAGALDGHGSPSDLRAEQRELPSARMGYRRREVDHLLARARTRWGQDQTGADPTPAADDPAPGQ